MILDDCDKGLPFRGHISAGIIRRKDGAPGAGAVLSKAVAWINRHTFGFFRNSHFGSAGAGREIDNRNGPLVLVRDNGLCPVASKCKLLRVGTSRQLAQKFVRRRFDHADAVG